MKNKNIAIITLDSLRYDSSIEASVPNFKELIYNYQDQYNNWVKVGSNATYTLPSHIAILKAGILPSYPNLKFPFSKKRRVFTLRTPNLYIPSNKLKYYNDSLYSVPEAKSLPNGFEKDGYYTLGIGGVQWFRADTETSEFWSNYFSEFYWEECFSERYFDGLENQIKKIESINIPNDKPLFFFMNVSSTHLPYRGEDKTIRGQANCLEYIDKHIMKVIDFIPKPAHIFIMGDHGDCMGEDDCFGHGFYHPKIMEVPMISLEIN